MSVMKYPSLLLSLILLCGSLCVGTGQAGVSTMEAGRLGTSLTPIGAEKAGNRDGTIPAYTGGLPAQSIPSDFNKGSGRWTTPFPDEKPLFSISRQNMKEYTDRLSEASKELLQRYPSYRMDIYPSHRTVAYPAWVLDNTLKNAITAHLTREGLAVEGAVGGIPFPIPRDGHEAMWNHMLVYNGYPAEYRGRNWYVDSKGQAVNTGDLEVSLRSNYYSPHLGAEELKQQGNSFFEAAYNFTAPPNAVGNASYSVDTLDPVDFKLVGKQEMYIPYNNYSLVFQSRSSQILTPNHLNPDFVRWELHRVWVVEATRKKGKSHNLSRRTFYLDEDWSGAGMSDAYSRNNQLSKGMFMAETPLYDAPMPLARCYWAYDLLDNWYTLIQHFGDPGMGYHLKPEGFPPLTFTPDALPNRGR
jgi:hypothetical protein